ncbi:PIN domain-containing protein [Natrarchaeobius oligotrophus]|uniref:PIN domain-containing protein n=1 Tax=Natrarchaeobius chitinivorans TaxID=1679083 RepID=A0A3N6PH41_NATCH|nr:PIN domain-containing protein [Natrarchaeobius chitinivorans]
MYVETDFLLALAKESDWLKSEAEEALEKREVATSILAYAEFLLLAEKYDIDRVRAVSNLVELVPALPEEHSQAVLKGVQYQDAHGMTSLDALHAGMIDTWDAPVLGSEQDYDELDIDRIPLEPGRNE